MRCTVTTGDQSVITESITITYNNPEIDIDGVIYKFVDDLMTVIGYTGNSDIVVVQETVNGKTVKVIGESAFEASMISKIDLPDTIELIGKRAFANCSNLATME